MRLATPLLAFLILALVGCGAKEAPTDTSTTEPSSTSSTSTTAKSATVAKEDVIGEWTMNSQQGNTNVEAAISIRDDGTFTNSGTINAETPGEDATTTVSLTYTIDGEWKLDGDTLTTTPSKVDATVDDVHIVAKDPANQGALDAKKDELKKQAEDDLKNSMNKPGSNKVEAHDDKLVLSDPSGTKVEYQRKK